MAESFEPSAGERDEWGYPTEAFYDRLTVELMRRILESESNCVDAGAHTGKFLRRMVEFAPTGTHYAFEPIPSFATRLRAEFPAVHVIDAALADWTGTAPFRHVLSAEGCSGFVRRPTDEYEELVELIDVRVITLDEVLPADLPIRFVKVDVEGAELGLFRGALRTLSVHRPFIAVEMSVEQTNTYDTLIEDAGLRVSTLQRWLAGRAALDRPLFEAELARNWFFLAYPPDEGPSPGSG